MKKKILVCYLIVLAAVVLVGCKPDPSAVITPTHLVCYQQGVRIVDAETIDGMMMKRVSLGGAAVLAWVWEDESGVQYLTYSETVSCQDSPLP